MGTSQSINQETIRRASLPPRTVVGYVRRSKESEARTVSLEDQAERIRAYCIELNWTVAEIVVDDGISGGKRSRLNRLEAVVRQHHATRVVIYHLDRFARDVAALLDSLRSYDRRGVELHVVGRGRMEAETASGYLGVAIEGVLAEHYRKLVSEKTRDALARLRMNGRRVSRWAPYGFTFAAGGRVIEEPSEQAVLTAIVALSGSGASLRAIAGDLAARGMLARNGRQFAPSTLFKLVPNRAVANTGVGA